MRVGIRVLLLLVILIGAACVKSPDEGSVVIGRSDSSPYPQVVTENGHAIEVEVVSTPETRARGLMFRRVLPELHGMLFLFPTPEVQTFWMKNTVIPLDIIWIDEKMRVIEIVTASPCELDPCPGYGPEAPTAFVLEIGAGEAERLGIVPGSGVELRNIDETRGS